MKYSIIMPYLRKRTLHNTLLSYQHHYRKRKDYEVLVMEDCKNSGFEHQALLDILLHFNTSITVRLIPTAFTNCYAPCRTFNEGVRIARGTYVLLTSPECFHETDVLRGFDGELLKNPDALIVASCYNTDNTTPVNKFSDFKPRRKIWLQHSKHINRGLHFCSVLSKAQYNKVGGFDEGYASGFGREDVDFVRMVKAKGIKVVAKDDIIVVHQNHLDFSPRKRELWHRNAQYFNKKWRIE